MIYIIDEFVLFLLNPFGMFMVMASVLIIEKAVIKNISGNQIKIRRIN